MFYPFTGFNKPQMFAAARSNVIEWCKDNVLLVYFAPDLKKDFLDAQVELRNLTTEEILSLRTLIDQGWYSGDPAGFTAQKNLCGVNGLCQFKRDETGQEARLVCLITESRLTHLPPLHSPVLQLALTELASYTPTLKRVFLPFGEKQATLSSFELQFSKEDRAVMAMRKLVPSAEAGWWEFVDSIEADPEAEEFLEAPSGLLELSLTVEPGLLDFIGQLLMRYGFRRQIIIEGAGRTGKDGKTVVDETLPALVKTFLFSNRSTPQKVEKIRSQIYNLGLICSVPELEIAERTNEEWARIWEDFNFFQVGNRFVVSVAPETYSPKPGEILIEIVPNIFVFGPGRDGLHPSTKLTLEFIEQYLDPAVHHKVLDIGTGSGVQSIAAAKLGAEKILALDAYNLAVEAARHNTALNGLQKIIQVEAGSLAVEKAEEIGLYTFAEEAQQAPSILAEMLPFDLIIANLFDRILIVEAASLSAALSPGGILICSGIRESKTREVIEALGTAGLKLVDRSNDQNWAALVLEKPPGRKEQYAN